MFILLSYHAMCSMLMLPRLSGGSMPQTLEAATANQHICAVHICDDITCAECIRMERMRTCHCCLDRAYKQRAIFGELRRRHID